MQGFPLILVFIISVLAMILAISRYKIHPFLSIMSISVIFGILAGIPLLDVKDAGGKVTMGLANVIGAGFSGTFTSIGIVIILGALIGNILDISRAAIKLAENVNSLVSPRYPDLAIMLMGWIVSIPVFCDSGYVILNPIRRAMVATTKANPVTMAACLSFGLYASHVFIPPTPGPIAAANILGVGNNLLLVIVMGVVVSVPALAGAFLYARYIGERVRIEDNAQEREQAMLDVQKALESQGELPGAFISWAPIIVPIVLMAMGSVASMMKWPEPFYTLTVFLGIPIIALAVGTLFAVWLLKSTGYMSEFYKVTNETLMTVGPILFITAAGGVLGRVIAVSDMVPFITQNVKSLEGMGILFCFVVAAILKTAQGSSTVAIITTAAIAAPLLPLLGLGTPVLATLAVMAIGAGAMTVSHANDSYFWVVTNFSDLKTDQGYKVQTIGTLVEGVSAAIGIYILAMFLK